MARIFVSHASAETKLADTVRQWLIDADHEVVVTQGRRAVSTVGGHGEQRVADELAGADAVVCLVSAAYLASACCLSEVSRARDLDIRLLPVRAEQGVEHELLESGPPAELTQGPDAARIQLIKGLRRIEVTRWARRFAQYTGIGAAIAAVVVVIVLNLLLTRHHPANALNARFSAPLALTFPAGWPSEFSIILLHSAQRGEQCPRTRFSKRRGSGLTTSTRMRCAS